MLDGCRVFHDIPYQYGNIDHVVVSHSGVYSINTKLRGRPTGDGNAHIIVDHGSNVIRFPDHEGPIPTGQLGREAKCLAEHLTKSVGESVKVEPMRPCIAKSAASAIHPPLCLHLEWGWWRTTS